MWEKLNENEFPAVVDRGRSFDGMNWTCGISMKVATRLSFSVEVTIKFQMRTETCHRCRCHLFPIHQY